MKLSFTKLTPYLIATAITGFVCLLQALEYFRPEFDFISRQKWITYDVRAKLASQAGTPIAPNLGAIFIDDDAIEEVNKAFGLSYPWSRDMYAPVLKDLASHGALAVGMDIFTSELHPDSVVVMEGGERKGTDEIFAEALHTAGNVVLATEDGLYPNAMFVTNAFSVGDIGADYDSDGVLRRVKPVKRVKDWHPILQAAERDPDIRLDLSSATIRDGKLVILQASSREETVIPLDEQGRMNLAELTGAEPPAGESPLVLPYEERQVWDMGVVLAAKALGADLTKALVEPRQVTLHGTNGVTRVIPLDRNGYFSIDWRIVPNDPRLKTVSFLTARNEAIRRAKGEAGDPEWPKLWKDAVVVIGSTATGNNVADRGATPLDRHAFLVGKHWNVANSILTGRFITRSSYATETFLILLLGAASAWLTWQVRVPWSTAWLVLAGVVYCVIASMLFTHAWYWLPIILPVAGSMVLHPRGVVTYRVGFEQKEKRRVKSVFAKLVSPNVVEEMLKSEKLNLGGSRQRITVFFADVRGFTSMTDEYAAKAEEYVRTHHLEGDAALAYHNEQARITLETVNMYLSTIADTVKKHGGTLDKYMGDCVMAFWGSPTPNPQHALSCVRAAIEAQRNMYALNQSRFEQNKLIEAENLERQQRGEEQRQLNTLLSLGTGINSGYAIVGLMGSERHILNYTVFGREVNVASRLEGVSGRGRIIIGEATFQEVQRDDPELAAKCMELEPVMVKGIKKAVRIFEVPWKDKEEDLPAPTQEMAATGFFRLESKETMHMAKPTADAPQPPGEAPPEPKK